MQFAWRNNDVQLDIHQPCVYSVLLIWFLKGIVCAIHRYCQYQKHHYG